MAKRRPLSSSERKNAFSIFRDSIDYDAVAISRGSPFALVTATGIGNTINLRAEHFVGDTLDLNDGGRLVLIHELGHVWQYQNGGLAYIRSSVFAQIAGWIAAGSRRAAYDWREAHKADRPWQDWNAEQQAECISHYHQALRGGDRQTMELALPYIRQVWNRDGAPGRLGLRSWIGG